MRELDEMGLYRGRHVYVSRSERPGDSAWIYSVIAASYIELETRELAIANGIAATLDALVPDGAPYQRETVLATLAILTGARRLLASIVEAEANTVRGLGDAVKGAAHRLYGQRGGR